MEVDRGICRIINLAKSDPPREVRILSAATAASGNSLLHCPASLLSREGMRGTPACRATEIAESQRLAMPAASPLYLCIDSFLFNTTSLIVCNGALCTAGACRLNECLMAPKNAYLSARDCCFWDADLGSLSSGTCTQGKARYSCSASIR